MLRWRLLIGIPLVALLIGACRLDAVCPAPGLVLTPIFLVCVYFMCRETLQLLNAAGIYPRRTTVYLGVFGVLILCWAACLNATPLASRVENAVGTTLRATARADAVRDAAADAALDDAVAATAAARRALDDADAALARARGAEEVDSADLETPTPRARDAAALSDATGWQTAATASLQILLAIAVGVLVAFVGEMLRFRIPGGTIINLSGAIFAIVYVGVLGCFIVMLRVAYGLAALASMVLVAKMCDIGAYAVGRAVGRHKMAPSLSPGKTIEGMIGGLAFAIFASWLSVRFIFPLASGGAASSTTAVGTVVYGVLVGASGALGDLAESLIKREAARKDSGTNVPGFGGFLDIFDSLLVAAPVAFALWALQTVKL